MSFVILRGDMSGGFSVLGPYETVDAANEDAIGMCERAFVMEMWPARQKDEPKRWYCCPTCGCTDIQWTAWVMANDPERALPDEAPLDTSWCPQCEDHFHGLETADAPKPLDRAELKRKWARDHA